MARLVIFLAIIGLAYWYWSGHSRESTETLEADRLQENAALMQRCIRQEGSMAAAGGVAGVGDVGSSGADAERLCAAKNHFYLRDGKWYNQPD
jgi:hypothetical protein